MKKYLIGSRLLGFNTDDADYDYFTLIEGDSTYKVVYENTQPILQCGIDYLKRILAFNSEFRQIELYAYQYDKDINLDVAFLNYSILDYIEPLKAKLKRFCKLNEPRLKKMQSKLWYHVAYNLFIIQNNSTVLSDEQKIIIKKLHDKDPNMLGYIHEMINYIYKNF